MPSARKSNGDNSRAFFDDLVLNALDFLRASVRDFKRRPKYSVINFCSGLEILFKARLILEHWSLIVSKPETAKLENFTKGDFHSVGLDEAIQRLQNVAGEIMSPEETRCFKQVREHRNRVVHFFHDAYSKKPSEELLKQIASEQCKAWFYLHNLLTGRWNEQFKKHHRKIEQLQRLIERHRIYLRAKFNALETDIKTEKSHGVEYATCGSCGFESARVSSPEEPVFESQCLVCGKDERFLRVACPDCGHVNEITDISCATCDDDECEADIDLSDVIAQHGPHDDPKDERSVYYCGYCEHHEETVIPLADRFFCLWCLEFHDSIEQCDHCGNKIAGFDPAGSSAFGCFMCSHSINWENR